MRKLITTSLAALAAVITLIGFVFVTGLRAKSPRIRGAVRKVARATQRFTIKSAGLPGAYASIVRHTGRASGRSYETPVRAARTDDGLVITLPYGANTDWLKNILKPGSATIVDEGEEIEVERPEVVGAADARKFFLPKDQRTQRLFGVDEYLRVHRSQESRLAS